MDNRTRRMLMLSLLAASGLFTLLYPVMGYLGVNATLANASTNATILAQYHKLAAEYPNANLTLSQFLNDIYISTILVFAVMAVLGIAVILVTLLKLNGVFELMEGGKGRVWFIAIIVILIVESLLGVGTVPIDLAMVTGWLGVLLGYVWFKDAIIPPKTKPAV